MASFTPTTTASTTYHVLTDGRWEVRATPPSRGIKKNIPLSLGFYASAADAKAASMDYYQNCPVLKDVPSHIEYKLKCENIALQMQVTSLLSEAKTRCSELVGLREKVRDLTMEEISLESSLPAGVTARSMEREQRRQSRAPSPLEILDTLFGGC